MVGKAIFWIFVTVLVIKVTGLSSDEIEDYDTYFYDDDSNDESSDNEHANREDEKWNQIDKLELIDDADDENHEMVQLNQISEVHGQVRYYLGQRVRGNVTTNH